MTQGVLVVVESFLVRNLIREGLSVMIEDKTLSARMRLGKRISAVPVEHGRLVPFKPDAWNKSPGAKPFMRPVPVCPFGGNDDVRTNEVPAKEIRQILLRETP